MCVYSTSTFVLIGSSSGATVDLSASLHCMTYCFTAHVVGNQASYQHLARQIMQTSLFGRLELWFAVCTTVIFFNETYEVFPLPLGPIMAFRPGFIDPLKLVKHQSKQN